MMDDFQYLSEYYDSFVGADYPTMAEYVHQKLTLLQCKGKYGVDLGCGSGTLTYQMAQLGYDMIGIDRSNGMLAQAAFKRPEGSDVLFLQQDLTDFELYGPSDFMISTLDCINYLDSEGVCRFLKACNQNLAADGLLIFDFNTLYKYESVLDGRTFVYETEDAFCVWENEFDGHTMYYDLTYFILNEQGSYNRFEDHQSQTYHSPEFIMKQLAEHGFSVLSAEEDYTSCPLSETTQRIVITAKKEQ